MEESCREGEKIHRDGGEIHRDGKRRVAEAGGLAKMEGGGWRLWFRLCEEARCQRLHASINWPHAAMLCATCIRERTRLHARSVSCLH